MQILAKRFEGTASKAALLCLIAVLVAPENASAQGDAPSQSTAAAPNSTTAEPPKTKPTTGQDSTNTAALEYLFNRRPQSGSIAERATQAQTRMDDKAKAADALGLTRLEDPQLRARFDRYLGMEEIPTNDLQGYAAQVDKILGLLKSEKPFDAWKELRHLASYNEIDAGVSLELANRIEAIWGADKASNSIHYHNERLKGDVRTATRNADLHAENLRQAEILWQKKSREGQRSGRRQTDRPPTGGVPAAPPEQQEQHQSYPEPTSPTQGLEGKLQLTEEYLRSLEAKAKIKVNELKVQRLLDAAKADFATYIGTLYGSHRHQHVILAANFYRKIFNEAEYPPAIANQVNASLEIAREVKNSIEVFKYKLERNESASATDRLQEAFSASEFDPAVLSVPRSSKERIADFTASLMRMQSLIEARDFGTLEALLNETRASVKDFDSAKPLAIVNAVKLESKLRLGKAKLAAQQGDLKLAMEEFQAAAEAWPGNPDVQSSAGSFFEGQDVKTQSLTEFDRLYAEKNLRAIFDKQLHFAPAIHGDAKREAELKEALEKIKSAEISYEKANLMRNAGDVSGAWEVIEQAATDLAGDIKLNMLRAELSGKAAEFVAAINKAKESESRKELGYSLSCYAVAQRYYPASTIANSAIQRISKEILDNAKPL